MIYKISPFYSDDRNKMYDNIMNSQPKFDNKVSQKLKQFIEGLLNKDPKIRLKFAYNIKKEAVFMKINFEKMLKK